MVVLGGVRQNDNDPGIDTTNLEDNLRGAGMRERRRDMHDSINA
jgi:hypothetical protein